MSLPTKENADERQQLGPSLWQYTQNDVLAKRTVRRTFEQRFKEALNYALGKPSKLVHKEDIAQSFFKCRDIKQAMHELNCTIQLLEEDKISPYSIRDAKILYMGLRNLREQIEE